MCVCVGAIGGPQGRSLSHVLIITFLALLWTAGNKAKDIGEVYCHDGLVGLALDVKAEPLGFLME